MEDFTNKYPYTDFHEMNLDWFLDHFDDVMKMIMQNNETVKGLIEYIHSLGLVVIDDNAPAPDKVYSSQKTQNLLNNKVDKITGYGLSQNDFTNTLKTKLEGIEAGANKTIVANTMSAYQTDPVEGGVIYQALNAKVDKVAGKQLSQENFTSTLKTKLDGIEAGATRILVDDHLDANSVNPVENGVITDALGDIIDELDEKQDKNEAILQAKNAYTLLCENSLPDSDPYIYRQIPVPYGKLEKLNKLIGASVVWNQLANADKPTTTAHNVTFTNNGDGSWTLTGTPDSNNVFYNLTTPQNGDLTIQPNHVYYMSAKSNKADVGFSVQSDNASGFQTAYVYTNNIIYKATNFTVVENTKTWARLQVSNYSNVDIGTVTVTPQIFDLTAMFGSTIADYVNTLETAEVGSGIAWLKSYGFFTEDYYAYSANTIQSVSVSKHITKDSESQTLTETALDHTTLRGLFKLDANNTLYADGDIYPSDGSGSVKYAEVDLGSLNYVAQTLSNNRVAYYTSLTNLPNMPNYSSGRIPNAICEKFLPTYQNASSWKIGEFVFTVSGATLPALSLGFITKDSDYTDATAFKTAMSGKKLVYEKATPTTATLTPFNPLSVIEDDGTEEFIDYEVQHGNRDISVPVGTDTEFLQGTGIPDLPTEAGTYNLQYNPATGFAWG